MIWFDISFFLLLYLLHDTHLISPAHPHCKDPPPSAMLKLPSFSSFSFSSVSDTEQASEADLWMLGSSPSTSGVKGRWRLRDS